MVGSSFAFGLMVEREESFAALLPALVAQKAGYPVDLYNEGSVWTNPHQMVLRFGEAIAAQPDLILWTFTPLDVQNELPEANGSTPPVVPAPAENQAQSSRPLDRIKAAVSANPVTAAALEYWHKDKVNFLLRHFLYESQSQYLKSSLVGSMRDQSGFLKANLDQDWLDHLRAFNDDAAEFEARAKAAGVPVVVLLLPNRAQTAMISMGTWPAGYDPYNLDNELRRIVESHGATYITILPDYRGIPNPEQGYFPMDQHPNSEGHALIARFLAKALTGGAVPGLAASDLRH